MEPELAKALLAVQAEAPKIQSDGINPHFGSSYVTLESLMETILPVLNKHGVVLIQSPGSTGEGAPALHTKLIHAESGHSEWSTIPLMLSKNDAQGQGSAITYARRYALMAMLGLAADADDDGNQAVADRRTQPTTREGRQRSAQAGTFDPGRSLLPQAIDVKDQDAEIALQLAQRDLDPNQDWAAIEQQLREHLFPGQPRDQWTTKAWREWWIRLANAIVKSTEDGDFPPPTHAKIVESYAWAFNGAVITLTAPETPFDDTVEAQQPDASEGGTEAPGDATDETAKGE